MGCKATIPCKKQDPSRGGGDSSPSMVTDAEVLRHHSWKESKFGAISHAQFVTTAGRLEDSFKALDKNKLLGAGAFGSVFKAQCVTTGATRAVKAIKKEKLHMTFLTQEVAIMREMDHPNIVKLFAVYEDARMVHMVMELCGGGDLFDAIIGEGHLTEAMAANLMQQVLRGICYLHEQYVAHRDIKDDNFLFLHKAPIEKNVLKLTDFGLSKRCEPGQFMDDVAGTADWVAPEVLHGEYDISCDVWSAGVLMFVLLTGYRPFVGDSEDDVLALVKTGKIRYKDSDWRRVSDDARNLVKQHLTYEPKKRCTAKAALSDVWIAEQAPQASMESLHNSTIIKNLQNFRNLNKLKKAAVHAVAGQLGEEQISEMREMFLALDKDGDGQLTAAEIRAGLQNASMRVPENLQKVLEAVDSDGSGNIDYTEFLAAAIDRRIYSQEDLCWAAFKLFDRDGDGTISPEEVRALLGEDTFCEGMGFEDVDHIMREVDTNGDGEIDFEEFMAMMRKVDPKRPSQSSYSRRSSPPVSREASPLKNVRSPPVSREASPLKNVRASPAAAAAADRCCAPRLGAALARLCG